MEVFFVISGFILPWSMYSADYKLRHYGTFLLKRIIRLDPPYLAAILLSIALAYVSFWSPGYRGGPLNITVPRVLAHLAYLNAFFRYEWLNPVFWSLAIEFQYYLLIGFMLPLISSGRGAVRVFSMLFLAALSLLPGGGRFLPHYIFLFIMGMLAFQHRIKAVRTTEASLFLGAAAVGSYLTLGLTISVIGLGTSIAIMFCEWRNWVFIWLGDISYSLYLTHVPVGGRIINLGTRFAGPFAVKASVLSLALMGSIGSAYLMFRFVEKPSQRWAKSVRYRRRGAEIYVGAANGAGVSA